MEVVSLKNMKKFAAVLIAISIIAATGAVFAAEFKNPMDIVSELTGKSIESLKEERSLGKTLGEIAKDNEKLEEFKSQMLEQKKAMLDQRVKDGKITQEKADEIYSLIKEKAENCDGLGAGMGNGMRMGKRMGKGNGMGNGNGKGMGNGNRAKMPCGRFNN